MNGEKAFLLNACAPSGNIILHERSTMKLRLELFKVQNTVPALKAARSGRLRAILNISGVPRSAMATSRSRRSKEFLVSRGSALNLKLLQMVPRSGLNSAEPSVSRSLHAKECKENLNQKHRPIVYSRMIARYHNASSNLRSRHHFQPCLCGVSEVPTFNCFMASPTKPL